MEYNQFYDNNEESLLPEDLPTEAIMIVDYCLVGLKKVFELYSTFILHSYYGLQ